MEEDMTYFLIEDFLEKERIKRLPPLPRAVCTVRRNPAGFFFLLAGILLLIYAKARS